MFVILRKLKVFLLIPIIFILEIEQRFRSLIREEVASVTHCETWVKKTMLWWCFIKFVRIWIEEEISVDLQELRAAGRLRWAAGADTGISGDRVRRKALRNLKWVKLQSSINFYKLSDLLICFSFVFFL